MNILQKMGLVEKDRTPEAEPVQFSGQAYSPEQPSFDLSSSEVAVDVQDVVESIYSHVDSWDADKSIFRMRDFINSMPAEMPTQTKYTSIGAILKASRIDVQDLILDAENRMAMLQEATTLIQTKHERLCLDANEDITKFLEAVEAAKVRMAESQSDMTEKCAAIQKEKDNVFSLLEFARGVVQATGEK